MNHLQRTCLALTTLRLARHLVGSVVQDGIAAGTLWLDQDETLLDRLDLVIGDLRDGRESTDHLATRGIETLIQTKRILVLANRTGALRYPLWAAPSETLFNRIDATLALLGERQKVEA